MIHTWHDGSVLLSREEWAALGKAYGQLYDLLTDGPAFLGDYFDDIREYRNVVKWQHMLRYGTYYPENEDDEDLPDEEVNTHPDQFDVHTLNKVDYSEETVDPWSNEGQVIEDNYEEEGV